MKTRYILARQTDCTLGEWFDHLAEHGNTDQLPALQLQDVTALIRNLCFIVEHSSEFAHPTATAQRTLAEATIILDQLEG
jgi:hypothetical protein